MILGKSSSSQQCTFRSLSHHVFPCTIPWILAIFHIHFHPLHFGTHLRLSSVGIFLILALGTPQIATVGSCFSLIVLFSKALDDWTCKMLRLPHFDTSHSLIRFFLSSFLPSSSPEHLLYCTCNSLSCSTQKMIYNCYPAKFFSSFWIFSVHQSIATELQDSTG